MSNNSPMTDEIRARRHVLGQQMYRLRRRYRYLKAGGLDVSAAVVEGQLREMSKEYVALGGLPVHRGNVL